MHPIELAIMLGQDRDREARHPERLMRHELKLVRRHGGASRRPWRRAR